MATTVALPVVVVAVPSVVDVDCYGGFGDSGEWTHLNEATTSTEPDKHDFAIETALELPLSELYMSTAELHAMPPAVTALLADGAVTATTASPLAVPSLPLRIASEKIRGIAFQLWPAAQVMSKLMRQLQHDLSVADPPPIPDWMVRKAAAAAEAAGSDFNGSSSSSASTPSDPSPSLSPLASSPLPPLQALWCSPQPPGSSSCSPFWAGKRVLELGSGCGLVGMLAATLGARVTLTDMGDVVSRIQANVDLNFGGAHSDASAAHAVAAPLFPLLRERCTVAPLEWGAPLGPQFVPGAFDVILLSDCVYWEDLFAPLMNTLRALCAPSTLVLLCQSPRRPKVERRFYKQARKFFCVVLLREVAAADNTEKRDVKLYRLQLKEAPLQLPKATQRVEVPSIERSRDSKPPARGPRSKFE